MNKYLACHLIIFACLSMSACNPGSDSTPDSTHPLQLQVISPHGSDIKREFAEAFSRWHEQHFGAPVEVLWPDIGGGGTGNIVRQLNAAYAQAGTSGYDVVFGGGSASFNQYGAFLTPLPAMTPEEAALWPSDPVAAIPDQPVPLHGANRTWTAAALSSFGMEVNLDRISELDLPMPRRWEDLAGPAYFGRLSLADPSKSGSVKTSYEMILQQYGWEEGWGVLTRLFANANMVRESGAAPADDVASAEAVAGITIDFYGRLQVARAGTRLVAYVTPEGGTALDSDPIALLKGSAHPELAARFIRFVLSPEGQRLWALPPGAPGGPRLAALGRLPALPLEAAIPASQASYLKYDPQKAAARNAYLGDLLKAALIDNHEALVQARQAIRAKGDPPELLAKLEAPPPFCRAHLDAGGLLRVEALSPLTEGDLAAMALEWSPPKEDPRAPYAERVQNTCRNLWRNAFAQRFADLQR